MASGLQTPGLGVDMVYKLSFGVSDGLVHTRNHFPPQGSAGPRQSCELGLELPSAPIFGSGGGVGILWPNSFSHNDRFSLR